MKVAQAISRALVSEGVTLAAGIAGQSIWPVIDAHRRLRGSLADVCAAGAGGVRHLRRLCARQRQSGGGVHRCRARRRQPDGRHRQFLGRLGAGAVPRRAQRAHQGRQQVHQGTAVPRNLRAGQQVVGDDRRSVQGGGDAAARLHASAHRAAGAGRARRAASTSRRWRSAISNICRCRRVRACAAAPIRTRSTPRSISSPMPSGPTSMSARACCSRRRPTSWFASPSC